MSLSKPHTSELYLPTMCAKQHIHKVPVFCLQVRALEQKCFCPSACTWAILEKGGRVVHIHKWYAGVTAVQDSQQLPTIDFGQRKIKAILDDMMQSTIPENEGYAQALSYCEPLEP